MEDVLLIRTPLEAVLEGLALDLERVSTPGSLTLMLFVRQDFIMSLFDVVSLCSIIRLATT